MNKNFTQMAVALIGMSGLIACSIISLFLSDMSDERNLLLGGLIAAVATSAAWLFKNTNNLGGGK